jgi:hypothetical protein
VNEDGLLPTVFVADGNPCSYLRIGTIDEDDPDSFVASARQSEFTVPADEGDYIVIEFDLRGFGSFDEDTAEVTLSVTSGGSVNWTPQFSGGGWHHFKMSALSLDEDPEVEIAFDVCDPDNANNLRMDIDNVEAYASSTNPCPTPEDCDMVQSSNSQFCQIDVETPLGRDGIGLPDCPCVGDLDEDADVDIVDFLELLYEWTSAAGCYLADLDCDQGQDVDANDELILLAHWGPCDPLDSPSGGAGDLDAALVLLGFEDLSAYEEWLSQASEAEALASAFTLATLLAK